MFSCWSAAFVKNLVREVDRELYGFFDKSDCRDYLFLSQVSGVCPCMGN